MGLQLQSFPDPYPFGYHKAFAGASEGRTLGFTNARNAVYKLQYTFAHSAPQLEPVMTGDLAVPDASQNLADGKNWGIGRMTIKTD